MVIITIQSDIREKEKMIIPLYIYIYNWLPLARHAYIERKPPSTAPRLPDGFSDVENSSGKWSNLEQIKCKIQKNFS